jgi:hypothetical protein
MNRMPVNTTLLAVVIATLLFLVANYFDDKSRWMPKEPAPRAAMNPVRLPGPDEPISTIDSTGICDRAERELLQTVDNSRLCSSDDDCTLVDFGYPIQCMTSVAKDDITTLRLHFKNYESSCRFRVYYDCPTEGAERLAVCRNHQCTVELETIESLRDQTLDFLGIDQ